MTRPRRPRDTAHPKRLKHIDDDHTKGTTVKPTDHIATPASTSKNGLRARLGGLFRAQESGAPAFGGVRNRGVLLVALVVALGALLAVSAAPVFAFQTHVYEESFGLNGAAGSIFGSERPGALGIDQLTGNIYVGDSYFEQEVSKFNLTHEPEPFTGMAIVGGRLTGFGLMQQLAVDSSSHVLYVAGGHPVMAYQPDGEPANFTAGPGVGTNELPGSEVCGVAVDADGDIYVSEFTTGVQVYKPNGEPIVTIPVSGACNLAVAATGVVYANTLGSPEAGRSSGPVQKLTPSGPPPVSAATTYGSSTIDANPSFTVALDPSTGNLYVDEGSQVAEYDEAGERLGTFGGSEPGALAGIGGYGAAGLAINGVSGRVYVAQGNFEGQVEVFGPAVLLPDVSTGKASEIEPQGTATLTGVVNPDGVEVTECYFEYGTSTSYGQRAGCEPEAVGSGTSEVAVSAKLKELEPGATYHFRLVASNKTNANKNPANDGGDETFDTPPQPSIAATSTANLTASSVDLNARVNPGGLDTTYHIEYGTSTEYGTSVPVPDADIGAGSTDVSITQHVEGLSPNVTYHWRVVATNAAGTTAGVDHTFIYDTSGEGLPDHRAYEMVTPPQKNGALIGDVLFGVPPDIAESGARVMLTSIQCFAGSESCTADRELEGEPFLFTRTATGWVTKALAPPGRLETNTLWKVNAEAGTALFSAPTLPMSEDDFYVRGSESSFSDIGPATPPADEAQGWPWGAASISATSDFSHVVYQEAATWWSSEGGQTPFEYSGTGNAAPVLVGVSGGVGSKDLISACNTALGNSSNGLAPGTLSADGETVFFRAEPCAHGTGANAGTEVPVAEVYARVGGARTVAVSEPSAFAQAAPYTGCETVACVANVNERAQWQSGSFDGASDDGSRAFFSSSQQLTDGASQGSVNLYAYDFAAPSGEHLIDVSAGDTSGHGARVQGVVAISADGSHVYFVAQGVLTATAGPARSDPTMSHDGSFIFFRKPDWPDRPRAQRCSDWRRGRTVLPTHYAGVCGERV